MGQPAGTNLVAHLLHRIARRPDEGDPGGLAGPGDGGVLGQKAVAGVDRVDARLLGDLENALAVEVGLGGRGRPDAVGLVGQAHVREVGVDFGVDGDGADADVVSSPDHTDRDLSAVGDQELFERGLEGHA